MDPSTILAWARGLERLAIVGLSGVSLILGWDLFRRGVVNAQNADFAAHGWKIRLQRVGPGIFFALFATGAFAYAIAHPLEITTGKETVSYTKAETKPGLNEGAAGSTSVTEQTKISMEKGVHDLTSRDVIISINTFRSILLPAAASGLDANNAAAINRADHILDSYKKNLMFQQFDQMSIIFYSIRDDVPIHPSVLTKQTPAFQAKYPELEALDKDTFLRRR